MELSSVPSVSGPANAFTVKVATNQSDQYETVMGQLLQGISETPAPTREGHSTGHSLNVIA